VSHYICDFVTGVHGTGNPIIDGGERTGLHFATRGATNLRTVTVLVIIAERVVLSVRNRVSVFVAGIYRAIDTIIGIQRCCLTTEHCITSLHACAVLSIVTRCVFWRMSYSIRRLITRIKRTGDPIIKTWCLARLTTFANHALLCPITELTVITSL